MTQELRTLADATLLTEQWYSANFLDAKIGNGEDAAFIAAANPAAILALIDRVEKADALVKAIKTDRHDWEDWPDDSREAFRAMEASK